MPQGDKSSYTDKQKRQAQHIEEAVKLARSGKGYGLGILKAVRPVGRSKAKAA